MIKSTKVPIICICNDRVLPKIRSLANYCYDLRFPRPKVEQIKVCDHTYPYTITKSIHTDHTHLFCHHFFNQCVSVSFSPSYALPHSFHPSLPPFLLTPFLHPSLSLIPPFDPSLLPPSLPPSLAPFLSLHPSLPSFLPHSIPPSLHSSFLHSSLTLLHSFSTLLRVP